MVDDIVNREIIARRVMLENRQGNVNSHNVYDQFEKARIGQEGEVRTRQDGSKWKKVGGKWIPLKEAKTPPRNLKNDKKKPSKSKETKKPTNKVVMPSHITRHHIGILRHVKSLVSKKDYAGAHELASSLPDNVKHEIPSDIWHKMIEASHNKDRKEMEEGKLNNNKENKSK